MNVMTSSRYSPTESRSISLGSSPPERIMLDAMDNDLSHATFKWASINTGFNVLHMVLLSLSYFFITRNLASKQGGGAVQVGRPGQGSGERKAPRTARHKLIDEDV